MVTRPILRYHGGKWMLAKWIISYFAEHKIYTEACGGAASVLLQKRRAYAEVYNDIDDEVVNLFKMCREYGEELVRMLELTPFSRTEYVQSYDHNCDSLELARRTIIRSLMGRASGIQSVYKTGFRNNNNRAGTSAGRDWANYPGGLKLIVQRLQGVLIENRSAIEVMQDHDSPKTLHYLDPPYLLETRFRKESTNIYKHEMNTDHHVQLLKSLADLKGMVIISGYDNSLYNEMLEGWQTETKEAIADGHGKRIEKLWISPNIKLQHKLF